MQKAATFRMCGFMIDDLDLQGVIFRRADNDLNGRSRRGLSARQRAQNARSHFDGSRVQRRGLAGKSLG